MITRVTTIKNTDALEIRTGDGILVAMPEQIAVWHNGRGEEIATGGTGELS